MNRWIVGSWCALPALFVAACGGGIPSGPSGEITQTQAQEFRTTGGETIITLSDSTDTDGIGGEFAGDTARRSASLFESALRLAGAKRSGERTSCTLNKGSTTDSDTDGVRDDSTDTYTCDFGTEGTFTLDGNTKVKDDLVNATTGKFPLGGATVTPTFNLTFSSNTGGTTVSGSINTSGLWNFILAGSTASGRVEITQTINVNAAGQSASGEIGWYLSPWSVTPTDLANPEQAGAVSWTSYFRYKMADVDYTLEGKTTNLVYNRACARGNEPKYNGGHIEWVDGAGNKVKAEFATNCSVTWTYNGAAL